MACTCPSYIYPPAPGAKDRRWVSSSKQSYAGAVPVKRPCKRCIGCMKDYASEWGVRCVDEARFHQVSVVVTLTYADEHFPDDGSVSKAALQGFFQRVRDCSGPFRYIACGEYGSAKGRPHYHAVLFGMNFANPKYWRKSPAGVHYYRSDELERLWPFGHCEFSFFSAKAGFYVAGYLTKAVSAAEAESFYTRADPVTGEVQRVAREFLLCSRRPGIGFKAVEAWGENMRASDSVVVDGVERKLPIYYSRKLGEADADWLARVKADRRATAELQASNNTDRRLMTRDVHARLVAAALPQRLYDGEV